MQSLNQDQPTFEQQIGYLKTAIRCDEENTVCPFDTDEEFRHLQNLTFRMFREKYSQLLGMQAAIIEKEIYVLKKNHSIQHLELFEKEMKAKFDHIDKMITLEKPHYNRAVKQQRKLFDWVPETQIALCIKCNKVAKFKCANCQVAHFCSRECAKRKMRNLTYKENLFL